MAGNVPVTLYAFCSVNVAVSFVCA